MRVYVCWDKLRNNLRRFFLTYIWLKTPKERQPSFFVATFSPLSFIHSNSKSKQHHSLRPGCCPSLSRFLSRTRKSPPPTSLSYLHLFVVKRRLKITIQNDPWSRWSSVVIAVHDSWYFCLERSEGFHS